MNSKTKFELLGTEKISKLLFEMSFYATFSLLVYSIYSIINTYFLSIGINSLAAASASIISPVLIILAGVATTVGVGGASFVSRALGEGNIEKASQVVANSYLIFWTVTIIITIFGIIFIRPIIYLLGATDNIAPYAVIYGRIIFIGAITSTGFSNIIRAYGDARYATLIWVVPITVNIIFCWLFIMIMKIGIAGAALATVLGQAVSAGMSIYFFFFKKGSSYNIKIRHFKTNFSLIKEIILIGLPSFIKNLSATFIVILANNLLKVTGGDLALSVYAIVSRVYFGFNILHMGIMQGMQPIVGYNFGLKRFERVSETIRLSLISSVVYGLLVCILCIIFPIPLISMLSKESSVILESKRALQFLALSYPLTGVSIIISASFQSMGRAKEAFIITLGSIFLVKIPVLIIASKMFSLNGIFLSEAISEMIMSTISLIMLKNLYYIISIKWQD